MSAYCKTDSRTSDYWRHWQIHIPWVWRTLCNENDSECWYNDSCRNRFKERRSDCCMDSHLWQGKNLLYRSCTQYPKSDLWTICQTCKECYWLGFIALIERQITVCRTVTTKYYWAQSSKSLAVFLCEKMECEKTDPRFFTLHFRMLLFPESQRKAVVLECSWFYHNLRRNNSVGNCACESVERPAFCGDRLLCVSLASSWRNGDYGLYF